MKLPGSGGGTRIRSPACLPPGESMRRIQRFENESSQKQPAARQAGGRGRDARALEQ